MPDLTPVPAVFPKGHSDQVRQLPDATVSEQWSRAIARWVESTDHLTPTTRNRHRHHLEQCARHLQGEHEHPSLITAGPLAEYLNGRPWSDATRWNHAKSLRVFFTYVTEFYCLPINPAAELTRHRPAGRLERVYPAPAEFGPTPAPIPVSWATWLTDIARYARAAGWPSTTLATRRAHWEKLARHFERTKPEDIGVEDLIDWLGNEKWARETRRLNRASVRALFLWAAETGRRVDNPAAHLPKVKAAQPLPQPAREDDYSFALRIADGSIADSV